jgi:carbonic anhydrase
MCELCGDAGHVHRVTRRDFLKTGTVAALAPWGIGTALAADPPAPGAAPPPNAIAPADALKRLMEGNGRYAANAPNERDFSSGRAARAQAVSDRGDPELRGLAGSARARVRPGAGRAVRRPRGGQHRQPRSAGIHQYGLQFLGAACHGVLGHTSCGAVDSAVKVLKTKVVLPGHLPDLIKAIKPAVIVAEKTQTGSVLDNAIAENVRRQVARLKTSPPIVQKLYTGKKIDVVGAVYDLASGKVALV